MLNTSFLVCLPDLIFDAMSWIRFYIVGTHLLGKLHHQMSLSWLSLNACLIVAPFSGSRAIDHFDVLLYWFQP